MPVKPLIIGNWKMNGLLGSLNILHEIHEGINHSSFHFFPDTIICLPATLIAAASKIFLHTSLKIGAQDCAIAPYGAYTGDISAEMFYDAGARYVLLGHSERKKHYNETNSIIFSKVQAAWRAGLVSIVCIGENLQEKREGKTFDVLENQILECLPSKAYSKNTLIAYEPVWAVNSDVDVNPLEISKIHTYIHTCLQKKLCKDDLEKIPIVYGGSVNTSNAKEILSVKNIDGLLVGRASLKASDFLEIYRQKGEG